MNESEHIHPAAYCHQCGRVLDKYKADEAGPGLGICSEHGVSYGREYVGTDSIWGKDGSLREGVSDEVRERVANNNVPIA